MKVLRKIIWYLLIIIILASAGLVTYLYFNKDKIIDAFVNEINNYLQVEAQVGAIDLNSFEHWPYIGIELQNTSIRGKNCAINQKLIEAKEIAILVNPLNIIRSSYEIKRLLIVDANIYVYRGTHCNNYEILKTGSEGRSQLDLKNVTLKNTQIVYDSRKELQYYSVKANKSSIALAIGEDLISLNQNGKWQLNEFRFKNNTIALPSEAELEFDLEINQQDQTVSIQDFAGNFLGSVWNGKALFHLESEKQSSLSINTERGQLANFRTVLPKTILEYIDKYKAVSEFELSFGMEGDILNQKAPSTLQIISVKSSLYSPEIKNQIDLKNFNLNWKIKSLGNWQNSTLEIKEIDGMLDGSAIKSNITISNLKNPILNLELYGSQPFQNIYEITSLPIDSTIEGTVEFDIAYEGPASGSNKELLNATSISGIITLENLNFSLLQPNIDFRNVNGQFAFSQNDIDIKSLSGEAGDGNFNFDGHIRNLIPFALLDDERLYVNSSLQSDYIDIQNWLSSGESDDPYILNLPERIIYRLDANIGRLKFKRFNAKNAKGTIILRNEALTFDSVEMDVAGGHVDIDLDLNARNKDRIEWFTQGEMENVYIDSLFYIFNNFNQTFIEQRHLEGQIDTDFTGFLVSDDNLNFDDSKLMFSFNTLVKNGRLILFEPLQEVSHMTKESDLMNLRFDDLRNEIFIQNRVITIPKMEVYSNIRTITIEGKHTFDNELEYHLEIPISGKKKDRDERFGVVEDPKTGKAKLLILIEGTASDYTVKYDKQALKQNIKTGVKDEIQELKNLLKKKDQKKEDEALELDEDEFFDFN